MNLSFTQDFGPIGLLVLGAAACAFIDLRPRASRNWDGALTRWVALAAIVLAFLASIGFWRSSYGLVPPDIEHGSFVVDRFALFFYAAASAAAGAVVVCGADSESEVSPHLGVYHALLLVATAGVLFTASAADLASLAVGLAMTVLPLNMALGLRKTSSAAVRSAARSLMVSAGLILLFVGGEAIIAGVGGATALGAVARHAIPVDPLMALAALLILIGALGQIGIFPAGAWKAGETLTAPVGAATARTALVSLAAFAAVLRILPGALGSEPRDWTVTVAVLAGLTLLAAPLQALRQRRMITAIQHLLIAQLALPLLALTEVSQAATATILYSLLAIIPLAAVALALLGPLREFGQDDTTNSLRGLWARSPVVAGMLTLLIAAAAGLPPLAGFFVRIFAIEAAAQAGFGWLLWIALLSGLLSALVAYRWITVVFDSRVDGPELDLPGRVSMVGIVLCGVSSLGFVVALGPLLGIAARAALAPLFGP